LVNDFNEFFLAKAELQKIMQDAIEYQWQKRGSSKENCLIASLLSASNPPLSEEQLLCDAITLYTIGIHVTTSGTFVHFSITQ